MGRHLHVGFEFEFGGLHLSKYSRTADTYRLEKMEHGVPIVRTVGVKNIGDGIRFGEIQTEGVLDHPTHGIPEHVGAPFRPGGSRFEAQRYALKYFKEAVGEVLASKEDFMLSIGDRVDEVRWYKLKRVVEKYNQKLAAHSQKKSPAIPGSRHTVSDRILEFRMQLVGSKWVIGQKKTNWGQASIQTNVEVPFLKIGLEGGMPTRNFDNLTAKAFEELRQLARELVDSLNWWGQNEPFYSMFTLFFFAMYIQWQTEQQNSSKLLGKVGKEASIAAEKSRWVLLPKVEWQDLWEDALKEVERKHIGKKIKEILQGVPDKLDRFRQSRTFDRLMRRPFEGEDGRIAKDWLQRRTAAFFAEKYIHLADLSPTGGPLPVINYGDGRNPTIVFEIRNSGAAWNHDFRNLSDVSVDLGPVIQEVLAAQS